MNSTSHFRRMLSLEREAAEKLKSQGYVVLQFRELAIPGNLLAAMENHWLFVTLKQAHNPHSGVEEVTKHYSDLIRKVRTYPHPEDDHYEIWVFIFATGTWQYYQIGQDQVTEVDHGV